MLQNFNDRDLAREEEKKKRQLKCARRGRTKKKGQQIFRQIRFNTILQRHEIRRGQIGALVRQVGGGGVRLIENSGKFVDSLALRLMGGGTGGHTDSKSEKERKKRM